MKTDAITNPLANPYDAAADADRHDLWEVLIARDSEAFAAADWSVCDDDFAHDRFEGISAHGSFDPVDWTLRYPTVESYRDDWLDMAKRFLVIPFAETSHRELLYRMQKFAKVEIAVGTGKKDWDKRQTIAERDSRRDTERELADRRRRHR